MNLLLALLLAVASGLPLIVLVTRADKRRQAVAELRRLGALGVITQEESDRRTSIILNRSIWQPDPLDLTTS